MDARYIPAALTIATPVVTGLAKLLTNSGTLLEGVLDGAHPAAMMGIYTAFIYLISSVAAKTGNYQGANN